MSSERRFDRFVSIAIFSYADGVAIVEILDLVAICGGDVRRFEDELVVGDRTGGAGGKANSARRGTIGWLVLQLIVVDVVVVEE